VVAAPIETHASTFKVKLPLAGDLSHDCHANSIPLSSENDINGNAFLNTLRT
jgi:hypothetical protein